MTSITRTINVRGSTYSYVGDVPNSTNQKTNQKEFWGQRGYKVCFRVDPNDKRTLLLYKSVKKFNELVKKYNGDPRSWH